MNFTFIDMFAGIGGFHIAFERLGGRCVWACEKDRFCQETYKTNFGQTPAGDIRLVNEDEVPDHDILLGGFPCQPFSIAGVSKKNSLGRKHGFQDKEQGNLFFDIARILEAKKPKAFLLENVKNLKTHDHGRTFDIILKTLKSLNYNVFWQVLDASHCVPQHRERLFIAGFRKDHYPFMDFRFPTICDNRKTLKQILEKNVDGKYTLTNRMWQYLKGYAEKHRKKGHGFGYGLIDPDKDKITRTLSARYYKDGSEILIRQKGKNPRRLTPRECARLMGFWDTFKIPVSDTQAYKQFGNAVVVPLIQLIGKRLLTALRQNGYTNQETTKLEYEPNQAKEHQTGTYNTSLPV